MKACGNIAPINIKSTLPPLHDVSFLQVLCPVLGASCSRLLINGIPDKDKWINVERARWAKAFNIPMNDKTPEGFPPLTLSIMRALCALTVLHPGEEGQKPLTKCLDALYHEFWVNHKKTNEKEVLAEIMNDVLGKEEAGKGEFRG